MTIKKFEDIEAWQLARSMCLMVKTLSEQGKFAQDWSLRNQIRASSGSVMDCIAEGFGRAQNNEFRYFLGVAKGSCEECRSQTYRALDFAYISTNEFNALMDLCNRTSGAIQGLISYLNKTSYKGSRNLVPPPKTDLTTDALNHRNHEDQYFPTLPPNSKP